MYLSFWNYLPISCYKEEIINFWYDLGSNLAMSFIFDKDIDKKEDMLSFLDKLEEKNIKAIIVDKRTSFYELDKLSTDEFRKNIKEAYADFGKHKSTYGFFVGDEPDFDHIDKAIQACKIVKEEMPGLVPFINFLPYYNDLKSQKKYGRNKQFFDDIITNLIKETKIPMIGFDQYNQCYDDLEDKEKGVNSFIEGLDCYSKICQDNNVDLHVTLLSVGHYNYRVPNFNDLRWQFNISLAFGAKGIVWFYFHQKSLDYSYVEAPFFGENFIKTSTYNNIKIIQNQFNENFSKTFDHLKFENVVKSYKNKAEIGALKLVSNRKLLYFVSKFIDVENLKEVYMIMNGSQKYSNNFIINDDKNVWLAPGEFILVDGK